MSDTIRRPLHGSPVARYALLLAAGWTLVGAASFFWDYANDRAAAERSAHIAARERVAMNVISRPWDRNHGGVRVPIPENCETTLKLIQVDDSEAEASLFQSPVFTDPSGLASQSDIRDPESHMVRGHITSLNPVSLENSPDVWERHGLISFQKGENEFFSIEHFDGEASLRLMRPLEAEPGCLKCHAGQGFEVGKVCGGISVSVPMAPYVSIADAHIVSGALTHIALWLLGLGMIALGAVRLRAHEAERRKWEESLLESEQKYRTVADYIWDWEGWRGPDGSMLYISPSCARISGYDANEFTTNPDLLAEIIHPEDKALACHNTRELGRDYCNSADYRIITRSGETRWIAHECQPVIDGKGAFLGHRFSNRDITDRKQTEEALRKSEERFRELAELLPETIFETDLGGRLTFVNQSAFKIFGYDQEDLSHGVWIWDMLVRSERERAQDAVRKLIEGEESELQEWTALRRDGNTFPVLISSRVISRSDQPIGLRGLIVDITRSKSVEEELRQLSASHELLLASVPDIIVETDCNKVYTWANKTGFEFFGDDLVGREAAYYFEGEQGTYEMIQPLIEGSEDTVYVESWQRRKDGRRRLLAWWCKTRKDADGNITGTLSTARDITEQQKAREALSRSEARYHELFNCVVEGIGIVDDREIIQFCNPAFVHLFEVDSESELVGRGLLDFLSDEQRARIAAETDSRKMGKNGTYELEITTGRGTKKTILASISPRFDDSSNYCGSFAAITDITEIKRLQNLETRAQRLATAGQIAGQVAHDFNNMLAPMMAYPEFLHAQLPEGDPGHFYLDAIESSAQKIADLNQQLLTMSRRGHYNQVVLSLNDVIEQVLQELGPLPETLTIETGLAPDLMNIMGGLAQLHRVIMNLVTNARDATQDIGIITVTTENCYVDTATIAYAHVPRGEYVRISVSDNGCGIPDRVVQNIFDPFYTTKTACKQRGSGLGLSVVDNVVRDHEGYIDLSTRPGVGTSFYLYFPITRTVMCERSSQSVPLGDEKLLVVDDDDTQREVSRHLLASLGYAVTICGGGVKALELCKLNRFDLLVLDMIMPNDLDGTETYRRILRMRPGQKAILVSGFSGSDRVAEAQRLGAGTFVRKPFTKNDIAVAVRRELDRSPEPTSVC